MSEAPKKLRTGWTTGTCAAAAAKAATQALLGGHFPKTVQITLPKGQQPEFALSMQVLGDGWAQAGIIKDAGDDPDVTHGAEIRARISHGAPGSGLVFVAGEGVGTVTKPGLPLGVGEPAINPVPRLMIDAAIVEVLGGAAPDLIVEISIPDGAEIALKTWNGRLGIKGGLSILGTTGIVRPFSCAAWIASIHRGIDVVRAEGRNHVIAATGNASEAGARKLTGLDETACLDMGDFAGGVLKYLRRHPIARLTLAGGIGKLTKLAQGAMDLHSARSQVDFSALATLGAEAGLDPEPIARAETALAALTIGGAPLAMQVARAARAQALATLAPAKVAVQVLVCDRAGTIIADTGF
ncbi:MAG: cobalt-precorrin-5B (C(1))-methyltransferase [Paracoccaceae bacterium]